MQPIRKALASLQRVAPITPFAPPINTNNSTRNQAEKALGYLEHFGFIGGPQLAAVKSMFRGEERQFFFDKMCELAGIVATMPETYQTDGQGGEAIAYLHYFAGGQSSWWITEKDRGTIEEPGQHQAFGLADLFGDGGELGYISIVEILENRGELDFHFTPITLAALKEKRRRPAPSVMEPAEAAAVAEFDQAPPANLWLEYENAYTAGNRAWFPCAGKFREDMLCSVPPLYAPIVRDSFGSLFACGECWKHTPDGQEVLLWFRSRPAPQCRIATMNEITKELKAVKV